MKLDFFSLTYLLTTLRKDFSVPPLGKICLPLTFIMNNNVIETSVSFHCEIHDHQVSEPVTAYKSVML